MYGLYLNRANIVLGQQLISLGGISGTVIDIRMILQTALKVNASSIIIAHNHPSGNLLFSSSDRGVTQKLKEASKLLDIKLLDHLVITSEGYSSMSDEGVI